MIELKNSHITVIDVDAAIAFYRDGLGLEVVSDVSGGGHRWVGLGAPGGAGTVIVLSDPDAGRSPQDGAALAELVAKGAMSPIVFRTDDLDALFAQVVAAGGELVQEPTVQPWGPKDAAFRDPSGNMVRIEQA